MADRLYDMNWLAWWRRGTGRDPGAVYVTERFGVRSLHIGSDTIQSAMRLARPNELELAYTRAMMAFLLFVEDPRRALVVGLGGGSIVKFLYHRLPRLAIEVAEVNPCVVAVARRHFHVPQDDARLAVHVADGSEYVAREGASADVIAVDGYDGRAQVPELGTEAFYRACARRLGAGGLLVVNLWSCDRRFDENLARIEAAFPAGTLCLPAQKPGNVIVLAFRDAPGDLRWQTLERRARALEARFGLEFVTFVRGLRRMNRHDERGLQLQPTALARSGRDTFVWGRIVKKS